MLLYKKLRESESFVLRLRPVSRIFLSLLLASGTFFIMPAHTDLLTRVMIVWIAFAFFYLLFYWIVLFKRTVPEIKQMAKRDEGSGFTVFILILVSSFGSMFTVLLLMLTQNNSEKGNNSFIIVDILGMIFSWIMVHSVFIVHYAHKYYYDDDENDEKPHAGGLEFPKDDNPDYIDFAYFSFVLGCTFQVSDVEISSKQIRRIAMVHGLLSFALNTFVVALTINLIAGLNK